MALNQRKSILSANAEVDARGALMDGGWLDIYAGTQPEWPEDAPGPDCVLLASLQLSDPAFGPASDGAAVSNAIASDPDAAATGTATWYRLTRADHITAVEDGSIGPASENDANLILTAVLIAQHAEVIIDGFIIGASRTQ